MTGQILTIIILIVVVVLVFTYLSDMLLTGVGIFIVFMILRAAWLVIGSKGE